MVRVKQGESAEDKGKLDEIKEAVHKIDIY
jgi:hypothetical protein